MDKYLKSKKNTAKELAEIDAIVSIKASVQIENKDYWRPGELWLPCRRFI